MIVTFYRLLEGPWGECDLAPHLYELACIDYAGYSGARDNLISAKGKLDRALGKMPTRRRLRWVYDRVREQLPPEKGWWVQNEYIVVGCCEFVPTWKHLRELREPTIRERMWLELEGLIPK